MKLVIELDDKALSTAVQSQVDQAVAKLATDALQKSAEEIIAKKFERLDLSALASRAVKDELTGKIDEILTYALGSSWDRNRRTAAREIVAEEARKLIQEATKQ